MLVIFKENERIRGKKAVLVQGTYRQVMHHNYTKLVKPLPLTSKTTPLEQSCVRV